MNFQILQFTSLDLFYKPWLLHTFIRFTKYKYEMKNQYQQNSQKDQLQHDSSNMHQKHKHSDCNFSPCSNFSTHQCPEQIQRNYQFNIIKLIKVPMDPHKATFNRAKNYQYQRNTLSSATKNSNYRGNKSNHHVAINKDSTQQIKSALRDQNINIQPRNMHSKQLKQIGRLKSQNKSIYQASSITLKKQSLKSIIFSNHLENKQKEINQEKKLKFSQKITQMRNQQKNKSKFRSKSREEDYRNTLKSLKAAYANKIQQGKIKKILPELNHLKQLSKINSCKSKCRDTEDQQFIDLGRNENAKNQSKEIKKPNFTNQHNLDKIRNEKSQESRQFQNSAGKIKFRMKKEKKHIITPLN